MSRRCTVAVALLALAAPLGVGATDLKLSERLGTSPEPRGGDHASQPPPPTTPPLPVPALAPEANLEDWQLGGFADLRGVLADGDRAWTDGGWGKLRYGAGDADLQLPQAAVQVHGQILPELSTLVDARYQKDDRASLQLIEAYARYRPVSLTPWRWSVKAGAFFPPVSFENTQVGWTSPWTISSSAINTWVGEELRSLGVEPRLEYRAGVGRLDAGAAAFWNDDPAGELMAARGFAIGDAVYGYGGRLREADAYASRAGYAVPRRVDVFQEYDGHPGWHADVGFTSPAYGRFRLLRYDNRADPSASDQRANPLYGWHTKFWSLATEQQLDRATLIAQVMDGTTLIVPSAFFNSTTGFRSAFLLAGMDLGDWRPALRVERFRSRTTPSAFSAPSGEYGTALTAALNWQPRPWLRLTAEAIRLQGTTAQRRADGAAVPYVDGQGQLNLRLYF